MHHRIKEQLLQATELNTVIVARSIQGATRVLKNQAAAHILALEQGQATPEKIYEVFADQGGLKALQGGDPEEGIFACGQVVGLIDKVKSVREVIEEMVAGAEEIYRRFKDIGLGKG